MTDSDLAAYTERMRYEAREHERQRERELEIGRRAVELLREWCTVPWEHKTPEMLERTRALLAEYEGCDTLNRTKTAPAGNRGLTST
jgi:urease accessory protein UreF